MATFKFENKYACAAYFNMARDNFHRAMLDILQQVGIESRDSEDQINHVLEDILKVLRGELLYEEEIQSKDEDTKKNMIKQAQQLTKKYTLSNDKQLKFRKLLFRRFPILGPVAAEVVRRDNKEQAEAISEMIEAQKKNNQKELKTKTSNVEDSDEYYAKMRDVNLAKCLEILQVFAKCLTDCRDFYTHYEPFNSQDKLEQMLNRQHRVATYLSPIFEASRRINKDRTHLSQVEMEFLTGTERFKKVIVQTEDGKDKMVFREKEDFYFRVFGNSFITYDSNTKKYYQMKYDIDDKESSHSNVAIAGEGQKTGLSDFGIAYLCSVFISRHYAQKFTDLVDLFRQSPYNRTEMDILKEEKLNLAKQEDAKRFEELKHLLKEDRQYRQNTPRNAILKEILSIYRVRLPRGKRFDKHDDKTTIALDVLNELRRCPMPVYEHLSLEGQKAFHDEITAPNDQTPEVSERKRMSDRFPVLALRAIDEANILPTIRFHVQLGSFRYRFYEKQCIDGSCELRCLSKDISGFGRLSDIERLRTAEWANLFQRMEYLPTKLQDGQTSLDLLQPVKDTVNTTPYITDHRASYHIYNNRIGLMWNRKDQNLLTGPGLSFLPELKTGETKDRNGKTIQTALVQQPAPLCSLSIHELPALLFYQHLWKRGMKTTEQIIKDKYNSLVRFLTDVSEKGRTIVAQIHDVEALQQKLMQGYELQLSDIPKKLIKYLSHKFVTKHAAAVAEEQVVERYKRVSSSLRYFNEATKTVGTRENTYGKKKFVDIRHGKLAEQLAESLVCWLPAESPARAILTGLNYNKLKSFLATYSGVQGHLQQDLNQMLSNAKLIQEHPFLKKVLDTAPHNIEKLYYLYLKQEIEYLASFIDFEDPTNSDEWFLKENVDLKELPFVHHERIRFNKRDDAYCKALAKRYYLEVKGKAVWANGQERDVTSTPTLQLPDGLFTEAIREALKLYPQMQPLFDEENQNVLDVKKANSIKWRNHNVSYLIGQYLKLVKGDEPQSFYTGQESRFYRHYELFDILCKERNGNEFSPVFLSGEQVAEWLQPKKLDGKKEGNMTVVLHRIVKDSVTKQAKEITLQKEYAYAPLTKEYIGKFVDTFIEEAACQAIKKKKKENDGILSEREKERVRENIQEFYQGMQARIGHTLQDCQKNERALRRYKTQDIVLFLTAKKMLSGIAEDGNTTQELGKATTVSLGNDTRVRISQLKLCQILDGQFLNLPVDYSIPYEVKQKDGVKRQINITQQQMSIKNFGRLSRVLTDGRLDSLLQLLLQKEMIDKQTIGDTAKTLDSIGFNDLMSEFSNYDHLRPEAFLLIQMLEKKALAHLEDKESPDSHSFKALVTRLYDKSVAETLNSIRNSFSHNMYGVMAKDITPSDKHASKITDLSVPNVAMLMKERLSSDSPSVEP